MPRLALLDPALPGTGGAEQMSEVHRTADASVSFAVGELSIGYAGRRVALAGKPVELTNTEYAALYQLAVQAPRVITHGLLLQRVWGPERVGAELPKGEAPTLSAGAELIHPGRGGRPFTPPSGT